jgi:ABC-type dipeptide/oligopeptide/nickel transport system permease component
LSMKKAVFSPLCSALIIPGLGQIINRHLKKGVCILLAVFILFIAGMIALFRIIDDVLKVETIHPGESPYFLDRLRAADYSTLWYLLMFFAVIWLYSVLDAYLTGRKLDQRGEGDRL